MAADALQFGRYQLLERIAAGGMGEVYVGLQTGIGEFKRPVAVKLLLPHLSDDAHIIDMFLREARIAAQMQSAHIAQVFDVGFEHDRYFIAMELVRGVSLSKLIQGLRATGRRLTAEQLTHVARGLCDGLHVAHEQKDHEGKPLGVIHRDVTPHNILVSTDGVVKLTDFGIARVAGAVTQTKPDVVMGKLGYLAPEQMLGDALDRRVDIFAAGATLFHLAALEKPFDTPTGQLLDPMRAPKAPLRALRPDLPPAFLGAVDRALSIIPEHRFATARELRLSLPDAPPQDESLGALVKEVCSAALVELDRKTEHATRPHGTAGVTRPSDRPKPVMREAVTPALAPAPPQAPSASISLGAARPSRLPLVLGALGLLAGVVALGLALRASPGATGASVDAGVAAALSTTGERQAIDAGVAAALAPTGEREVVDAGVMTGRSPTSEREVVEAGVATPLTPALSPEGERGGAAFLSVDATPWGTVTLDGKPRGDTPVVELKVSAGEHLLRVENPETGKSSVQRLRLRGGETRIVRVDLR